jgi:hypothetical protein
MYSEFTPQSGPQVAPGHNTEPDFDPTFDIATLLAPGAGQAARAAGRAGEGLANIPIQAYRRNQVGKAIPQMKMLFDEMGTPLTNTIRAITGTGRENMPAWTGQAASAMADEGGGPIAIPGLLRGIRRKVDDFKGAWNVDIPYIAGGDYPQALLTKDADNTVLGRIAEALGERPGRVGQSVRGFYKPAGDEQGNYLADVIALRKQYATPEEGTLTHETGHLAAKRLQGYGLRNPPEEAMMRARNQVADPLDYQDYLEAVTKENPLLDRHFRKPIKTIDELGYPSFRTSPYANMSPERMGDELWTRYNSGQLEKYNTKAPFSDPEPLLSGRLSELVDSLIHPSLR